MDAGLELEHDQTRYVMQSLELVDAILPCLANCKWSLFLAGGDAAFVTCDRPVALSPLGEAVKNMPLGFGLPWAAVTVPLSKAICLRGVFDEDELVIPLPPQLVAGMNTLTITATVPTRVYARDEAFSWLAPDGTVAGAQELLELAVAAGRK
jgi:hypothetical protein